MVVQMSKVSEPVMPPFELPWLHCWGLVNFLKIYKKHLEFLTYYDNVNNKKVGKNFYSVCIGRALNFQPMYSV